MSRRRPTAEERGKGVASSSEEPQVRQTILEPGCPRFAGVQLHSEQQRAIWRRLSKLKHNSCRYAHRPTMRDMGIEQDVLRLASVVGFHRAVTGNWPAYIKMTMEFLSTLKVTRHQNSTPQSISFVLGGQRRVMTTAELDRVFLCRIGGGYIAEVGANARQVWTKLAWMQEERRNRREYNAQTAQAASIRNPAIRYFHRLLTCTVLGRVAHSKVQSHEMTIIAAALSGRPLSIGCYLADHFEQQQGLSGSARIYCGGMITAIALHVGVQPNEAPVSDDIYLHRNAIARMDMIKGGAALLWIFRQKSGNRLLPLPNYELTQLFDANQAVIEANVTMITDAHLAATIDDFRIRGVRGRAADDDGDEEMAEEEDAYEGEAAEADDDPRYFHVRAPDFVEMQEFITDGRQEDRMFQEQQFGGIYTFMDEQRAVNTRFEERFSGYDQRFAHVDTFIDEQRASTARIEAHMLAQQQQHAEYLDMMRRFGQHWGVGGFDPQDLPPPS